MRCLFCIFLNILLSSQLSWAQTPTNEEMTSSSSTERTKPKDPDSSEPATPPPPSEVKAKKILVTGSYIRQAVTEKSPTPLSTYDQSRMLETGSYTVADVLQESVVFNNVESGAFLSMHGQTNADNLVLLNGLRLPKTAGGTGVNIDFLPASAIERTEVLKDGASALYGSEALAGVVNIITKKDYDGANFFARHTTPQEWIDQETTVGMTYGKSWKNSRFLGILQFRKDDPVHYKDTEYGTKDVRLGGSLYSPFANLTNNGVNHRDPNCPNGRLDSRGRCRFDSRELAPIGTGENRQYYTAYLGYGHDFSEHVKVDMLTIYTRRDWNYTTAPLALDLRNETAIGGQNFAIPDSVTNGWGAVNSNNGAPSTFTGDSALTYSPLEELGTREYERSVDNYITQVRTYGEVNGWDWEASVGHGLTFFKDTLVRGNADKAAVHNLLLTSVNPLAPSGTKAGAFSPAALQTWFEHTSDALNAKVLTAGPLTQLASSPLSMAIGVEGQWQSFKFENDPFSLAGTPLTGSAANQNGRRQVYSGFVEFTHSPIKDWDIQLAGRFDEYSDVGNTLNPKIGTSYHASEHVTFRASYGTGFKAPDLLSVFQGQSTGIETGIRDPQMCAIDINDPNCNNTVATVTTAGSKNLKPELATHYNFGTVLTPRKDLAFTVDYWIVDGKEGLSALNPNTILRAEALGVDLSPFGIIINRDPAQGNVVTSITHPVRINAGVFKIRGIDFAIQKKAQINPFSIGSVNVRYMMEHSHVLSSGGTNFSFDPFTKQYNLNWKNFMSVAFQKDKNFAKVIARTFAGGDKNTTLGTGVGLGSTYVFTEYDLHYERFLGNESSISFGIKNILDTKPKNDTAAPGVVLPASLQGNYLGRTFYVGYSHDF